MERPVLKYYFHCSDGYDLIVDREGRELRGSDLLWTALDAAARLMSELQTYDGWADWVVAIHDERGSLIDTVPFPTQQEYGAFDNHDQGTEPWATATLKSQSRDGSTRPH